MAIYINNDGEIIFGYGSKKGRRRSDIVFGFFYDGDPCSSCPLKDHDCDKLESPFSGYRTWQDFCSEFPIDCLEEVGLGDLIYSSQLRLSDRWIDKYDPDILANKTESKKETGDI